MFAAKDAKKVGYADLWLISCDAARNAVVYGFTPLKTGRQQVQRCRSLAEGGPQTSVGHYARLWQSPVFFALTIGTMADRQEKQ